VLAVNPDGTGRQFLVFDDGGKGQKLVVGLKSVLVLSECKGNFSFDLIAPCVSGELVDEKIDFGVGLRVDSVVLEGQHLCSHSDQLPGVLGGVFLGGAFECEGSGDLGDVDVADDADGRVVIHLSS
jgi:hypothetical protein